MVGHKTAKFFDRQLDRNHHDQILLEGNLRLDRLATEQREAARLGFFGRSIDAVSRLHDLISAFGFGVKQSPVGTLEHGFRRIARLVP